MPDITDDKFQRLSRKEDDLDLSEPPKLKVKQVSGGTWLAISTLYP
jgi:hypothetical protein